MHRKLKYYLILGISIVMGATVLMGGSALAVDKPEIEISIPSNTVTSATLSPKSNARDWSSVVIPVNINISKSSAYQISVYRSCAGLNNLDSRRLLDKCNNGSLLDLENGNEIRAVSATATLPDMRNGWGYRWQMGDKYNTDLNTDEMYKSFASVPTSLDAGVLTQLGDNGWVSVPKVENGGVGNGSLYKSVSETLNLEFGASVDGDVAAGSYQGAVAVTVIAHPEQVATFGQMHFMQEMTPSECAKIVVDTEGYLEDQRDGKLYKVAKLRDNNCWMVQNLALSSNNDSTKSVKAYNAITGKEYDYELPASPLRFNGGTSGGMYVYNGSHIDNAYDSEGFVASDDDPSVGMSMDDRGCASTSTRGCKGENSGAYYSWLVATAQTANYLSFDDSEHNVDAVKTSICPKGWRLPTGGSNGEAHVLSDKSRIPFYSWHNGNSGDIFGGKVQYSGALSFYFTGTVMNVERVYGFQATKTAINDNNFDRTNGFTVRCIADTAVEPVEAKTMQEFTISDCVGLTGETELIDARDNKVYRINRLADGACWMVQNLALEGGTKLTALDSDVETDYTLPVSGKDGFSDNTGQYVYNGSHAGLAQNGKIVKHAMHDSAGYDGTTANVGYNSGAYYSWLTATAGSGIDTASGANAPSSICPKGWRLPTGGDSGEIKALYDEYSDFAAFQNDWRSGFSGRYSDSAIGLAGNGYWWSSTSSLDANAFSSDAGQGALYPSISNPRSLGFSIRCVKTSN